MKKILPIGCCILMYTLSLRADNAAVIVTPSSLDEKFQRSTDKDDFIYTFALQAERSDKRYTVTLISGRLVDGDKHISMSQMKLTTLADFESFTHFDITIQDIKQPGSYVGELWIKVSSGTNAQDIRIPVKLLVTNGIEVEKLADAIAASMTNETGNYFNKEDTDAIVTRYKIRHGSAIARITQYEMTLHGKSSGDVISASILAVPENVNMATEISIPIIDHRIKADSYSGWLKVTIEGLDNPVTFDAVSLRVKDGPFWVIVVLLAGLVAGRFIRLYNSKDTQDFYLLTDRISLLEEQARKLGADQILNELRTIRRKLMATEFDTAAIDKQIDLIEMKLIGFEQQKKKRSIGQDAPLQSNLPLTDADAIRQWIHAENIAIPETLAHSLNPVEDKNLRMKRRVHKFTGIGLKSMAKNWGFRIAMMIVLLLFVLILGFQINYVNKPDFGEMGFFDYFNVFLWSSGSTAILKSLFSIQ